MIDSYSKDSAKGCQNINKGDHLSIEGIRKGNVFREKWYIKGLGVGPRGGAFPYKHLLSTDPRDAWNNLLT